MAQTPGSGRAAFQVLVLPYRRTGDVIEYALFRRAVGAYWQGISGGGEDAEVPLAAARRETAEEAGLSGDLAFVELDARALFPVRAGHLDAGQRGHPDPSGQQQTHHDQIPHPEFGCVPVPT